MKEQLQATKELLLQHLKQKSQNIAPDRINKEIYALLPAFISRGKTVRGSLVLLTAQGFGAELDEHVLNCALALEYFQAMILIIDDIMDDDDMRRGFPTIHRAIEKLTGVTEKRGREYAICLSLIATFDGFRLLKNIHEDIMEDIWEIILRTSFAQIAETELTRTSSATTKQILDIYRNKTGKYTFSMPFSIGAKLADQDESTRKTLKTIGEELGVIFQIRDDMLEIIGDNASIGKSTETDIRNNIHTYQRALLYEQATSEEQEQLDTIFGTIPTTEQISYIQSLYTKYTIVKKLDATLQQHKETLLRQVKTLPSTIQQLIIGLAEFCITRTK